MLLFHMMVNNEHYISLIKLACAAVPYTGCPKKSRTIKKLVMHSLQILLSF